VAPTRIAIGVIAWTVAAGSFLGGCGGAQPGQGATVGYEARAVVTRTFPHSPAAFTEGLLLSDGWIIESTGLIGASRLERIELASGRIDKSVALPADVFGEGVAKVANRFVQLSWRNGRALLWNADTLLPEGELSYAGEGWGLCYDGQRLIMSDGSADLQFRDPVTFALLGRVSVENQGIPLEGLNELECVGGDVFANILSHRHIARIRAATGEVVQWIDTGGILDHADKGSDLSTIDVLNGIAAVPGTDRLLLTGKRWPNIFEVRLVPLFD
jgi:glutaminyl-peptide cyclotransferase